MKISLLFLISAVACAVVWCLCVYKGTELEMQSKVLLARAAVLQENVTQLKARRTSIDEDAHSWWTFFRKVVDVATWGKTSRDGTVLGEFNRIDYRNEQLESRGEQTKRVLDQLQIDAATLSASIDNASWWQSTAFTVGIICGLGCLIARRYEAATSGGSWNTKDSHAGRGTTDANNREQNAPTEKSSHGSTEHSKQVLSAGATVVSYTTIVQCPRCGQKLRVRGDVAIRVHCKACGTHFDKQPGPGTA